MSNELTVEQIL